MEWRGLILASILAIIPVAQSGAAEFHHAEPPFVPVHNCMCRFNGAEVPLGQRRCLATPQGPRTAQCVLEQNVTSWRPSGDECPQASMLVPRV